jgi:protein-S-isoprenylcysteine O-methyltransferase Ste14
LDQVRYFVAVLLVVFTLPGVAFWYVLHPLIPFWRRLGARLTLAILLPLTFVGMGALWPLRQALVGPDLGSSRFLIGAGVLVYGASAVLDRWARKRLSIRTLVGMPELSGESGDEVLMTDGPYAVVRHPRYLAVMVGITGWALVANHGGAYLVTLTALLAVFGIVAMEERELVQRFGEAYREYRERVPAILPRPGALLESLRSGGGGSSAG